MDYKYRKKMTAISFRADSVDIDRCVDNNIKNIVNGCVIMSPELESLKEWIFQKYDIQCVYVEIKENFNPIEKTQLVNLFIYTLYTDEYMCYEQEIGENIVRKYFEFCDTYGISYPYYHGRIFNNPNDYVIIVQNLKERYKYRCVSIGISYYNKYNLDSKLLWRVFGNFGNIVIFTNREEQRLNLENSRKLKKIKKELKKIIEVIDESNLIYFDEILFTIESKQNLDEHYQGNMFHYFKAH